MSCSQVEVEVAYEKTLAQACKEAEIVEPDIQRGHAGNGRIRVEITEGPRFQLCNKLRYLPRLKAPCGDSIAQ